jgi:hypothetical protein
MADRVSIACENSPGSTTLSGAEDDILAVKKIMDDSGIFARHLKTGKAYHSAHMDHVAPLYEQLYSQANANLTEVDLAWRQPMAGMVSSVTGAKVDESQQSLGISYWCDNLRGRVRFNTAVQSLCRDPELAKVKVLVEIGPHAALKGPVEQIMSENSIDMAYVGSLVRGKDDAVSLLKTAGELYLRGLQVEFDMVNSLNLNWSSRSQAATGISIKSGARSQGRCLVDLPPYQWNYDRQHWNEPRAIADLRMSKHPRHDVLGRRIFGLSSNAPTWKNVLRQRDVAWFSHHTLGTDVVFPAAAHVSLAIEALLQQLDLEPAEAGGMRLANIDIRKALMVPDSDDGIEVHTRLEKDRSEDGWYTFTVESVTEHEGSGLWTLHSTGKIRREQSLDKQGGVSDCPYKPIQLHQQVAPKRWYRSLERVGFRYGPSFQTMTQHVRANGKDRWASAGIKVHTKQTELESRYMLHPSTIDGCLHAVIAAVHRGLLKEMPWGVVPINIEEMSVAFPDMNLDKDGHCFAWVDADANSSRHFSGNVQLFAGSGDSSRRIMDIRNLRMISYEAALPPPSVESAPREPYRRVEWKEWDAAQEQLRKNMDATGSRKDRQITVLVQNNDYPLPSSALAKALGASLAFLPGFTRETLQGSDGVILDDEDGSVLACATEESWASLQKVLLQSGKPIIWVTRGANQGQSVNSGLPQGFLRAVRSEAPTARICLVDADKEASTDAVAALVQYQLDVFEGTVRSDDANPDSQQDVECWLTSDSRFLVPRLEPNEALNRLVYGHEQDYTTKIMLGDKPYQDYTTKIMLGDKPYKSKLMNDQVVWEVASETRGLDPLEVEIRVKFAELTKSDLSARAEGGGTRTVTGTIIRTGSDLDDAALNGCAVVACTDRIPGNCFMDTHIITSVFAVVGEKHADSMGDLQSALPLLSKAIDALALTMNSTHELNGQHVIIVAEAAASPFEQAVTKLAVQLDFRVSTVVSSAEDRGDMRRLVSSANMAITTGTPRVDLIQDIWQAMPARSTFVFGNDTPIETYSPLDAKPLARGVMLRTCGGDHKLILETSLALLDRFGDLAHPPVPMTAVDVQELSNSGSVDRVRRSMVDSDDTGVLKMSYGQSKVKVKPTTQRAQFAPDGSYLLVGCLGGLGRSLTTWMLERGCRNFIFLSRSGATKPEAVDVVGRLTASGASVQVFSVDASDEKAVSNVVKRVSRRLPIRGVVHAAMVLRDGLYENMTFSDYQAALRPKKQGALALHTALGNTQLDFFLMTSSISAVLGNPGQANYCAANSFLDFLALHRRQNGLAACSIALPMVEDVGVVAENAAVAEALARKMPFGINEKEMLTAFEAAILHGQPSSSDARDQDVALGDVQLVVGLDTDAMLQAMEDDQVDLSDSFWHRDARMSSVRTSLETKQKTKGASSSGQGPDRRSFAASLDGLPQDEVLQALGKHIVERCARILGSEPDTFQLEGRSLGNHGVDSMIGVELQRWLFTEFGLQVSVTTLSDPKTTFAGLARTVAGHLGMLVVEEDAGC